MRQKITYRLSGKAINPDAVGLIREYMLDNYEIEKYKSYSEKQINFINKYCTGEFEILKGAELLSCVNEDDEIHFIDFEHLNLDERTMLYFFFCVEIEDDTDVVFSVESHAIQRLWLNGKMVCLRTL